MEIIAADERAQQLAHRFFFPLKLFLVWNIQITTAAANPKPAAHATISCDILTLTRYFLTRVKNICKREKKRVSFERRTAMSLAYAYEEERRTEKLNGEVVMMAPQTMRHHFVSENLFKIFSRLLKGRICRPIIDGAEVFLTKDDTVVPDMMVVCNRSIIKVNGIQGVPDLIIEVLSRSTAKRDRGYKKDLYERCGVRELWHVDPVHHSIEIYALENEKYVLTNVYHLIREVDLEYMTDKEKNEIVHEFSPVILPDIIISLEEIFEDADY
jgi:Uma2 family endonuclease